jgi:UPF0716 protein FxsA
MQMRLVSMPLVLLLVLIAFPLLELGVLIKVGRIIGVWPTLAIVVGTALLGVAILRREGFAAPFKIQEALARGEAPIGTMADRAMVVGAAVLLITPGLIADAIGLLLLIPIVRHGLALWASRGLFGTADIRMDRWTIRRSREGRRAADKASEPGPASENDGNGPIIEGDFRRIDERSIDPERRSPRNGRHEGI